MGVKSGGCGSSREAAAAATIPVKAVNRVLFIGIYQSFCVSGFVFPSARLARAVNQRSRSCRKVFPQSCGSAEKGCRFNSPGIAGSEPGAGSGLGHGAGGCRKGPERLPAQGEAGASGLGPTHFRNHWLFH